MNKPRILIVTNRIPYPLSDGGALAMHGMVQGYHRAGWEVFLCAINTSRHYVANEDLPGLYREIGFVSYDMNTDVKLGPTLRNFLLSRKPNHADRFYDKGFAATLVKIISDFEPEVIQLESVYLATYLQVIREATAAKVAIRLHNIEYQIWERLAREASTLKRFYLKDLFGRIRKFETAAWGQADLLIAISESDARHVKSLLPGKEVITVPFGIDVKNMPSPGKAVKWVGYHIGAMDWLPNAEAMRWFLDEVWPELHREVPSFEFYFAGRNMPGSFEKYEKDGVTCAGEVVDAYRFIEDKKLLIVPLRSGGGIRVKILEAMAAGKLVVSTAVGMQGIDAAKDGVHFLLAEEKDDFVRQVKWAIGNTEKAEAIASAARVMVREEYDQERIMSLLTGKMEELRRPAG